MKRLFFFLISAMLVTSFIFSCTDKKESMQSDDQAELEKQYQEIMTLANKYSCENAGDWKFTAIGSKACGGASGYIAYSVKTDESSFLKKVDQFTKMQADYNKKWAAYSDCALVVQPKGVTCDNGKPKFTY